MLKGENLQFPKLEPTKNLDILEEISTIIYLTMTIPLKSIPLTTSWSKKLNQRLQ